MGIVSGGQNRIFGRRCFNGVTDPLRAKAPASGDVTAMKHAFARIPAMVTGRNRLGVKFVVLAGLAATLAGMVLAAGTAAGNGAEPGPTCSGDVPARKIKVGIVQMIGCFTETTRDGATIYTADPAAQPVYGSGDRQVRAIDMNGFLVDGRTRTGDAADVGMITVNTQTGSVRNVGQTTSQSRPIQLYTINMEAHEQPAALGEPFALNFTAPKTGSLLLEDLRFGSNSPWAKALAGFSPALDIENPVRLLEDGKGSMDISLKLTGIFTLKGKPQAATIKVPSAVGEGSKVDGFELKLEEIDGIKLVKITSLEAEYSASEKKFGGGADFSLPIMNGKGVSFGFEIEDGVLTKANVGASGLEIPVGAPPAGMITAINGGFGFTKTGDEFLLSLNAGVTAEFGPKIPTPWGKIVPLEASSALKVGKNKKEFYFLFDGGVKVFRLPVGDVYLRIYTATGVEFGFNIGVGFPSYSNNRNDPFYIGTKVDGWIAGQKFQFDGAGRVRLLGLDIFDGRILINNRVAGACWKVTWFDGGAVYEYGARDVRTFGIGCGLDNYREKFPPRASGAALVSSGQARRFTTGPREVVLSARGRGDAPRFRLVSKDGRRFVVPRGRKVIRTKGSMIVVDRENRVTHVAGAGLAKGRWTIEPYQDSAPIVGVKTGRALPAERVDAEIRGRGLTRKLVWSSRGNPHTKIAFTELMKNGTEKPILTTDRVRGQYRFRAAHGGSYGKRRLKAYVIHGGTPREVTVEDRFTVRRPGRLRSPRGIRAWRAGYRAGVVWRGVPGARGYVAQIAIRKKDRTASAYRQVVGPRQRRIVIPSHPGGSRAKATVQALNIDGVPGLAGGRRFRLSPPDRMSLKQAGRIGAGSATRAGGKVRVRTACPVNGHCQTRVTLKLGGRVIARSAYQQVPDTYRFVELSPASKRLRKRVAAGRPGKLRVVVRQHRIGERPVMVVHPVSGPA